MILVDTSVWVDHLNKSDKALSALLLEEDVVMHPLIVGELAMANLRQREDILGALLALPKMTAASHDETLRFITNYRLFGLGIGYIDAHLLAAVKLTPGSTLWTRDQRLAGVAQTLDVAFRPSA